MTLALVVLPSSALAATIVADETTCTIVDAMTAAESDTATGGCLAGAGADTIELTSHITLTTVNNSDLLGDSGLPVVTTNITIKGNGFAVQRDAAAPSFRLFAVGSGGVLNLNDVAVSHGRASIFSPGGAFGGGVLNMGGTLHLTNTTISDNTTDPGTSQGLGGGVFAVGLTTLTDSIVTRNHADQGGGIAGGSATLTSCAVSHNTATRQGGGIDHFDGTLTLTDTTVSHNNIVSGIFAVGGGIYHSRGTTILTGCTISRNRAIGNPGSGGGIYVATGTLMMTNSTVSGNSAGALGNGGGITISSGPPEPTATLTHCTVTQNGSGGFVSVSDSASTFTGTIVAGNSSGNCSGLVADGGNNFSDDASCGPGFGTLTDFDNVLRDNGGPTLTHTLLSGSSAIDSAGTCGLVTDQRGAPRSDGACDSGAYERVCDIEVPLAGITLTWTNADDMTWSAPTCAESYNLYRLTAVTLGDADLDGLADDYGSCVQQNLMDPETSDMDSPAAGLASFYTITAENAVGEGSLGNNSEGEPRPNGNPCP